MSAAVTSAQGRLEIAKRELEAAERSGNPSRLEHARRNVAEAAENVAELLDAESRAKHPTKAPASGVPSRAPTSTRTTAAPWAVPSSIPGGDVEGPSQYALEWAFRVATEPHAARQAAMEFYKGSAPGWYQTLPPERQAEVKAAMERAAPGLDLGLK